MDVCVTPIALGLQPPTTLELTLIWHFTPSFAARVLHALEGEKEMASPSPLQMIDLAGRLQAGAEGASDPMAASANEAALHRWRIAGGRYPPLPGLILAKNRST